MTKIIEAENLNKIYGERVILDIGGIDVETGEILTVLGPSGAGKSVLLRLLNLLEKPTSGKILFDGKEIQGLSGKEKLGVARNMAMLFQDPLLFSTTIYKNVAYGLRIRTMPAAEIREKVHGALELVKLTGFEKKMPFTLSGGEAQRIALARALVTEPKLLFLDEPFANLDRMIRMELQVEVKRILKEHGLSAIFVTHDQEEAARMGDRIMILNKGKVVQEGTPVDVFYRPKSEFAARFVGMDNMIEGTVTGNEEGLVTIDVEGNTLEATDYARVGDKVMVGLRPEDIVIVPESSLCDPASSRNCLVGSITGVEFAGPVVKIIIECPFKVVSVITRRSYEELGLSIGYRAGIRFKATSVNLFALAEEPATAVDSPLLKDQPHQSGNLLRRAWDSLRHINEK